MLHANSLTRCFLFLSLLVPFSVLTSLALYGAPPDNGGGAGDPGPGSSIIFLCWKLLPRKAPCPGGPCGWTLSPWEVPVPGCPHCWRLSFWEALASGYSPSTSAATAPVILSCRSLGVSVIARWFSAVTLLVSYGAPPMLGQCFLVEIPNP